MLGIQTNALSIYCVLESVKIVANTINYWLGNGLMEYLSGVVERITFINEENGFV